MTYWVRYAFKCLDVPYRRHMVHSVEADSLYDAAKKVQKRIDEEHEEFSKYELISIHDASEIECVVPRPKINGNYETKVVRNSVEKQDA